MTFVYLLTQYVLNLHIGLRYTILPHWSHDTHLAESQSQHWARTGPELAYLTVGVLGKDSTQRDKLIANMHPCENNFIPK
jgi:hypothetical protein